MILAVAAVRESMEATLSNPPDHVYAYFWVIQRREALEELEGCEQQLGAAVDVGCGEAVE